MLSSARFPSGMATIICCLAFSFVAWSKELCEEQFASSSWSIWIGIQEGERRDSNGTSRSFPLDFGGFVSRSLSRLLDLVSRSDIPVAPLLDSADK